MTLAIGLLSVCALAWALTGLLRRYALRRDLLDYPGARSSHSVPTPRGGGVAIVVVFICVTLAATGVLELRTAAAVGGCGLLVAAIGFWDDHRHVAPLWRLLAHGIGALGMLLLLGGLPELAFGNQRVHLGPAGFILGIVAIVWLVNLYNFMDGIDGIASVEAITVAGGAAAIVYWNGGAAQAVWLASLAAAVAGFLVWNWPPARIFMGDAGSGFLGFILATLALATSHEGFIELWSWMILLGVFVTDATVTLVRRLLKGERVYEAHCSHAYQHAARRWGGHRPVALLVGAINLGWLLPLAWLASAWPASGWLIMILAYFPLVLLAFLGRSGISQGRALGA